LQTLPSISEQYMEFEFTSLRHAVSTAEEFCSPEIVSSSYAGLATVVFLYSNAESVNLTGQVVGNSGTCAPDYEALHAFLWESGTIFDLNTLISPGSGLTLIEAVDINDLGEIMGLGLLSNGEERAYLLVPCDPHEPGNCQNQLLDTGQSTNYSSPSHQRIESGCHPLDRFHTRTLF
jgi:probable HAF family extracellular repeat protein